MTPVRSICAAILMIVAGSAAAHGVRFGFNFGFPVYAPAWYYPAPAYYYPPAVVAAPRVYVERSDSQASAAGAEHFWYYCRDSQSYYPYVQNCASAWQRVSPRPADLR